MANNFQNAPPELRALPWVLWREETRDGKPTKVPYDAKVVRHASVDDPYTWADFTTAVNAQPFGYDGIGFVLIAQSDIGVIDIDKTASATIIAQQNVIVQDFNSYIEYSPNLGYHGIFKVRDKSKYDKGRKWPGVELYLSGRYITFTGNIFHPAPISDCTEAVERLLSSQDQGRTAKANKGFDEPQKYDDNTIIQWILQGPRGQLFNDISNGDLRGTNYKFNGSFITLQTKYGYPSGSEIDQAWFNIVAARTKNREQIKRIFAMTLLSQRDKAVQRPKYIEDTISTAFDTAIPEIDHTTFKANFDMQSRQLLAANATPPAFAGGARVVGTDATMSPWEVPTPNGQPLTYNGVAVKEIEFPPGLLGEIADYIYLQAPRPVREIALCAAIGLMAAIVGRTFNSPSMAGLNMYILLLAGTGTGKDAMKLGINRLLKACRIQCPAIMEFIGPSDFSHGRSLQKCFETQPSFVSIIGEFGAKLKAMCDYRAPPHLAGLKTEFLDLYQSSESGGVQGSVAYADKSKTIAAVQSPSFTILAESPPEPMYEALTEDLILQGLLPRFLILKYNGKRVDLNIHEAPPDPTLVTRVAQLAGHALTMTKDNRNIKVAFAQGMDTVSMDYDRRCTAIINNSERGAIKELWNRAHLKVLKLASLAAVGVNPYAPIITEREWNWARQLVEIDILDLSARFDSGDIGSGTSETKQTDKVIEVMNEFLNSPFEKVRKYVATVERAEQMHAEKIVPFAYIQHRLVGLSMFRNDRVGATHSLNRTMRFLEDNGSVIDQSRPPKGSKFGTLSVVQSRYGTTGRAFTFGR